MTLSPKARDLIGRTVMLSYFTFGGTLKAASIVAMFSHEDKSAAWVLDVLAAVASLGFALLIVVTTITRLPPKGSAEGIEPRLSALIGCFAMVALIALPRAGVVPDHLRTLANTLTLVGSALCLWCLWWLGRSFSIMAQARRLVVAGPYRRVRHPLYVCEAIILVGIVLRNPRWTTFTVAAVGLVFQYRRILHEERILRATFPEYAAYARQVPMLGVRWRTPGSATAS